MCKEHCMDCQIELNCLDEDPNGDQNCVCARCRAEGEHDFDREPNAVFGRDGSMKEQDMIQTDENTKNFVKATQLFDLISGAFYYGTKVRQVIATDPEACAAAKKLVERLAAHKCQGML